MNRFILLLSAWLVRGVFPGGAFAADDTEFFEQRIRPVLVRHCYECHSAAASQVRGGLRLDFRGGARTGGESGAAIVPGRPDNSLLLDALRYQSFEMPPAGKLPDRVIADFEQWIRKGATDPRDQAPSAEESAAESWREQFAARSRWWSLQPPRKDPPPQVTADAWSHEPVDRFVRSALDRAKLAPATSAEAEVLLRRLSLILTGLPPQAEQVPAFSTAFARNPNTALEALVDQLLSSPHFGERFARHWMDVVRYTDTYGYEWDNPAKGSWEYRDYLTRAFNSDVGFDQLIREQIAGDLLTAPRINQQAGVNESLIGPMFYHMGEHRHGSSLDFNGIHQEMINNKIDTFSKAFLAMTVACARCHDHKLDAISQADYYALAGVFMSPRWASRVIDAPGRYDTEIAELKRLRDGIQTQIGEIWISTKGPLNSGTALRQWASENRSSFATATMEDVAWPLRQMLTETTWLTPQKLTARAAAQSTQLIVEDGGSILARGTAPQTDTYTVKFTTGPGNVDVMRLEALTHDSLGNRGPGRTAHGNFVLSHIRVEVQPLPEAGQQAPPSRKVVPASARADYSQPNYPVSAALTDSPGQGWGVGLGGNVDRTASFSFADPIPLPHGGVWSVTLEQQYGSGHTLGRFRLTPGLESALPDTETSRRQRDSSAAAAWKRIVTEWDTQRQTRIRANADRFSVLSDFSTPGFPAGWTTEGDGITHGYVDHGTPLVSLNGNQPIQELLPRGYHTRALSSKLPGAVRLPPQHVVPAAHLSLRLRGGEWSGYHVIPQNAFQSGPAFLDPGNVSRTWLSITDRALKNGVTRVFTEVTTSSLNPNFPPRTGLAKVGNVHLPDTDDGFDKRSWFSLTGVVTHETAGTPQDTLETFTALYCEDVPGEPDAGTEQLAAVKTADGAWQRLSGWLTETVHRWADGNTRPGDVKVLNWLLAEGLLPNSIRMSPQIEALTARYRELESQIGFPRSVNSLDERQVEPINYRLNVRGDVNQEGPVIPRNFLKVFASRHQVDLTAGSGRLGMAHFLSSPDNPQTARVYVNRVWQWIFGTGIVATPNDFGKLGDRPSHPQLLDWLALKFMEEGWSTKQLIRRLVLSQTFRQSGAVTVAGARLDPDNRLLHHYPTRRLEAEAIRDSLLAVSGRLDRKLYGRPINPPRTAEDAKKRLFSGPLDSNGRRSLYIEMSIMEPPKFLVGFNLPDLKLPTGRRDVTNVPAQALIMLNDPLVVQLAGHWAEKQIQDGARSVKQRVRHMFVRAFGRFPNGQELHRWSAAVTSFSETQNVLTDAAAWTELAHALFNTKEFIYYR